MSVKPEVSINSTSYKGSGVIVKGSDKRKAEAVSINSTSYKGSGLDKPDDLFNLRLKCFH